MVDDVVVGTRVPADWYQAIALQNNGTGSSYDYDDSGWLTVSSLESGWSLDSAPMQARQIGNKVYMRGGVVNSSFNTTTYTGACTIPSGIDPPAVTAVLNIAPGGGTFGIGRGGRILTDGTVQFATSDATSIAYRVDGFFYLTD